MQHLIYLETSSNNPAFNLALEEVLLNSLEASSSETLFAEIAPNTPFSGYFLLWQNSSISIVMGSMTIGLLVIGLGMISALAMQTNLKASQVLPMNTFGMLSYLEPALMFLLSIFVLHEAVNGTMIASFALIWVGVLLMMVNAIRASKKSHSTAICD